MKNLAQAILNVMSEVKGIEKNMTVGKGNYAYKGVQDSDVKTIIGESMQKNGLVLLPIEILPVSKVERYEETDNYGTKTKQAVFTEVTTKYLLLHSSGESQVVTGYGQGVDNGDKAAGKATTYALKYLLLYLFLVPTGKIDDSDNTHSNDLPEIKGFTKKTFKPVENKLPEMKIGTVAFDSAKAKLSTGEITLDDVLLKFSLSEEIKKSLLGN